MHKSIIKIFIILTVMAIFGAFFVFDLGQYLSLTAVKSYQYEFSEIYATDPAMVIMGFGALYILITALSLPGAAVMTLAAGALFGLGVGIVLASFASTIGATLSMLVARFALGQSIQRKYAHRLKPINDGMEREGAFYLFTLRLVPVFPFFLVNLLMGLTKIPVFKYFWVSQLGMLPGTIAYIYAGTKIGEIESLSGILSPGLLMALTVLGLLPLVASRTIDFLRSRKVMKDVKKPDQFDYNIVVIGAGAGGLVSSYIASAVKAKVALIEKHKMGGDCLNTGCVPSKAIIRTSKILRYIKDHKKFGIKDADAKIDFEQIMGRVHTVIDDIAPHDSIERYEKLGVNCYTGDATVIDPYRVEVNGEILTTKNIIIATGARPFVPPIKGLDKVDYLTSDTLWNLKQLPKKLVVVGGGPIGCELAQSFARLGSKVTQIEMGPTIMGREDADVSEYVTDVFKEEGVNVLTNTKVVAFKEKSIICEDMHGKELEVPFDKVLLALGRQAHVTGFGLESLGVELTERGTIGTDDFMRTNYPNIYACGDVAGPYQFTHVAAHQAWYAAVNALFSPIKSFKADYSVIPWCTFVDPEVARVGLNETDAKADGVAYEVTKYDIGDLDRAIADSANTGFVKVLTPPNSDRILGVTIVGHHAGDLIAEFVLAMKHGLGLNKILGTIHIYPTLAESNKYVAGNWKRANAPETILKWIEKFHTWRR